MAPDSTRPYRLGLWLFLGMAMVLLVLAILGARVAEARRMGLLALAGFVVCLGIAAALALASRRALLQQRERNARASSLVIMAGMLNRESNETLQRIAASNGPAAEAAAMLLARRQERGLSAQD